MAKLLQIDFPFQGPFGEAMSEALADLARSIASEPGFVWKIWTESADRGEAGGIYLFEDASSAEAYVAKHTERLKGFGIDGIRARIFDVNDALTAINRGPVN
ncbi:MAG: monooxygenase [Gammaproteobacteria bacterium]|nr:monooxygenase [Gammaproteobacteria bacterium]